MSVPPSSTAEELIRLVAKAGRISERTRRLEEELKQATTDLEALAPPEARHVPAHLRSCLEALRQVHEDMVNLWLEWERVAVALNTPIAPLARASGKPKVLIVDDALDVLESLSTAALAHNLEPLRASNGLEALIVAHAERPAVILMDLAMPVLDGIEATRLLRASQVTRNIPVVAYTVTTDLFSLVPRERLFSEVVPKQAGAEAVVQVMVRLLLQRRSDDANDIGVV